MTLNMVGLSLAIMPGPFEMGVILLLGLLLFGSRLPAVMRNLGRGVTEFKKGIRNTEDEVRNSIDPPAQPPTEHTEKPLTDSEGKPRDPQ